MFFLASGLIWTTASPECPSPRCATLCASRAPRPRARLRFLSAAPPLPPHGEFPHPRWSRGPATTSPSALPHASAHTSPLLFPARDCQGTLVHHRRFSPGPTTPSSRASMRRLIVFPCPARPPMPLPGHHAHGHACAPRSPHERARPVRGFMRPSCSLSHRGLTAFARGSAPHLPRHAVLECHPAPSPMRPHRMWL